MRYDIECIMLERELDGLENFRGETHYEAA